MLADENTPALGGAHANTEGVLVEAPRPLVGKVLGLDASAYHAHPAVNASLLKEMQRSPLHAWARYIDPDRKPSEPTPAMAFGTACHTAVLEPEVFAATYALVPVGIDRRTKVGKEAWAEFEAWAEGRTILTDADADAIFGVRRAVLAHGLAGSWLTSGEAEASWFAESPDHPGIWLRGRTDRTTPVADGTTLVADLKTTQDATRGAFIAEIYRRGYHIQAAFYVDLLRLCGEDVQHFVFVAAEKAHPFAVGVYHLDAEDLEVGRAAYKALLATYAKCREANHWPGPSPESIRAEAPRWASTAAYLLEGDQ